MSQKQKRRLDRIVRKHLGMGPEELTLRLMHQWLNEGNIVYSLAKQRILYEIEDWPLGADRRNLEMLARRLLRAISARGQQYGIRLSDVDFGCKPR